MHNYKTIDKFTLKDRGEVHTVHIFDSDSTPIPGACSEILLDGNKVVVAAVERNHIFMATNYRSYSLLITELT